MRSFLWVIEMVAKTDIKFYVHTNNNAPKLQNAYGSMIQVLDACLVNGINIGAVSSLTASGATITALFSTAHNLMQYQVIKITGANQSEFNGEHRILTVPNAQSVTFELAAAPSVTTATGVIATSLPALGWEKPFSSSNPNGGGKAAYCSTNLLLPSRPFLRVVDELDPGWNSTYAKYAKVGIVEDMTGIDALLGVQAPYDSAAPDKNWVGTGSATTALNGWAKWYYASNANSLSSSADSLVTSAGDRNWILIGNADYFYILPSVVANDTNALCYGFGLFKSLLLSDSSSTFLSATLRYGAANSGYSKPDFTGLSGVSANQKVLIQRPYTQAAMPLEGSNTSLSLINTGSGVADRVGAYNLTNIAPFIPVFINEAVLRGQHVGFFWLAQNKPFSNYQLIEKDGALYIAVIATTSGNQSGQVVLNIGWL